MSSSDDLKKHRTSAKSRFTRTANELERTLDEGEEKRENVIVNSIFNDVCDAWKNVNEKHDNYMSSVLSEEEMNAGDEWIGEIQKRFYDLRKTINKINQDDEAKISQHTATRVRNVAYSDFTHMCTIIEDLIKKESPVTTIKLEREIINRQFMDVKQCHRELAILLRSEGEEKLAREWIMKVVREFSDINSKMDGYIEKLNEPSPSPSPSSSRSVKNICLEKMPLPKFEGDIQAYPRFRRDFVELVLPTLDSKHAPFVLRQCLSNGIVRQLNSNENDVNILLERLDEKFGDPGKLTDVIVNNIKKFKLTACHENLIQFIDLIESGYNDLKSLSLESEMCNSNMVSIIESKLPEGLALQWFREIHKPKSQIDKKNKFLGLLDFLRIERKALEYASSDLRKYEITHGRINSINCNHKESGDDSNSPDNCLIHKVGNHKTFECRKFINLPLNEKYKVLREHFACYGCLRAGHSSIDCVTRSPCTKNNCDRLHHELLHPQEESFQNHSLSSNDSNCLLPIMPVPIKSRKMGTLNVFWDSGATVSLIAKRKAIEYGLKGTPVTLRVTTIGGKRKEDSFRYTIPLIDLDGNVKNVIAYGIERITNDISDTAFNNVQQLINEFNISDIRRPSGSVDLLIGFDYAAWHPVKMVMIM